MRQCCSFSFMAILLTNLILTLCLTLTNARAQEGQQLHVLLLNPSLKGDPFWDALEGFSAAAARDLNIKLTVLHGGRNHVEIVHQLRERLEAAREGKGPFGSKIHAVMFQGQKKNGIEILKLTEEFGVKAFILNAGLTEEQRRIHGGPREKFKSWIGQMLPDDRKAGEDLLHQLVQEAKRKGLQDKDGKIHALAITGNVADGASIFRLKGLEDGLQKHPEVVLWQTVPAQWEKEKAQMAIKRLIKRYPQVRLVWSANDPMAMGGIEGLQEEGKRPGKDVVIGSIDWTPEALKAVEKGELVTTLGGHFMEGAFVLVLLHDYFHGSDFATEKLEWTSPFGPPEKRKDFYLLDEKNWELIDFTVLSKIFHPTLKQYDFGQARLRTSVGILTNVNQ